MESIFPLAAVWVALAIIATAIALKLKIATALIEIVVGIAATAVVDRYGGAEVLGVRQPWLTFLASTGSVALTFLAGAELDPVTLRRKWKEVFVVGVVGFLAPFLGCAAVA